MNKKWTKSKSDKMLGGVLGGLADYVDMDPTLVRILFMILWMVTTCIPLGLIYIILWVILPEEQNEDI